MAIKIPETHKTPFARILELPHSDAESLQTALNDTQPAFSPQVLAEQVTLQAGIPATQLTEIIGVLVSLIRTSHRYELPTEELVDDVLSMAAEEKIGVFASDEPDVNSLRDRLLGLLSSEALVVTAKATDVLAQHKNPLHDVRILTDIRYVFSDDEQVRPVAGMIVHNLEIVTFTDGLHKSRFFALDSRDLQLLRAVVERATAKEAGLQRIIEESGTSYVSPVAD